MKVWTLVDADFSRHVKAKGIIRYIKMLIAIFWNPSFMVSFWYRLAHENYPIPLGFLCSVISHYVNILQGFR